MIHDVIARGLAMMMRAGGIKPGDDCDDPSNMTIVNAISFAI